MTADAGFVCASRRPQRAGDANCRRCNSIAADAMPARSIGLPRPATVKRCSTRGARNSIPEHSETTSVTICRELSDLDQIIKSKHQWDRSTAFLRARTAPAKNLIAQDPPAWSSMGGGSAYPELFAPAGAQLNAPTTPTAEGECFGRLVPGATVHRGQCVLQNSGLLAPADDRNALATTPAGKRK